jgi:hypothetical protein
MNRLTQVNFKHFKACYGGSVFPNKDGDRQMEASSKLRRLMQTSRDQKEIEDWLFSLTPLGVAFVFFIIFVLPMDLPNKDMILVTGIAAGFIGLQSYWVFRGWRKNHGSTVLLGIIGIVITLSLAWGYMAFM